MNFKFTHSFKSTRWCTKCVKCCEVFPRLKVWAHKSVPWHFSAVCANDLFISIDLNVILDLKTPLKRFPDPSRTDSTQIDARAASNRTNILKTHHSTYHHTPTRTALVALNFTIRVPRETWAECERAPVGLTFPPAGWLHWSSIICHPPVGLNEIRRRKSRVRHKTSLVNRSGWTLVDGRENERKCCATGEMTCP